MRRRLWASPLDRRSWSSARWIPAPRARRSEDHTARLPAPSHLTSNFVLSVPSYSKIGVVRNCEKKNRRGRKEESGLKFIVTMYLFTSARPNPSTPSTEGKRRLSEMSERFPVNVTVLDTGHFMNFQYSFLLPGSLVFLQYSFTKPDGNIMETTRHQDLNSALTWNLFLFHTPVGCYFPADALRVAHIKLTHCVELSRGGKEDHKGRTRWREKWEACVFPWHWHGICTCKCFRALTADSPVCWGSFVQWLFPHGR